MTYLSTHFTIEEVTSSSVAERLEIDNSLPEHLLGVVRNTAAHMELVRLALHSKRISINSWYRCLLLNRALKSKDTSQHLSGEAVDFKCAEFGTPLEIVKELVSSFPLIRYDQIILEHTWVHISFNSDPSSKPRGQVLTLLSNGTYAVGITNKEGKEI